jgi:hypothetical protein
MRKKIGDTIGKRKIYALQYGPEGQGKTTSIMTLSKDWGANFNLDRSKRGLDVAFITAEERGPTAVRSKDIDGVGFSDNIVMEVLSDKDYDLMFKEAVDALNAFSAMPNITVIGLDGLTAMCMRFVNLFTDGGTDQDMGWGGWGALLGKLRALEAAAEAAYRRGKSVIMTGHELPPQYEETQGGTLLKEPGRLWVPGKGKLWVPANVDISGRITSHFKKVPDPRHKGKMINKWIGQMQVHASAEWVCKTRWSLPNPAPANWGEILKLVAGQQ